MRPGFWRYRFLWGIGMFALFTFGFGALVMLLWNNLLPEITGVQAINFWQAVGLLILARLIFGGWGPWGRWRHRGGHWRNRMHENWVNMSPEERTQWKQEMRGRYRNMTPEERANWHYGRCGWGREEKVEVSGSEAVEKG